MKVSIIVPAFNAAETLRICLTSVCQQMKLEDELIVVDDGSSDLTGKIASEFTDRIITHPKNMGLPKARQSGLDAAKQSVCVYFDADVELLAGCLNRIKHVMSDRPEYFALTGTYSVNQPFNCIWSKYKSYTTTFNMQTLPEAITFLHGAVFAIRKTDAPRFDGIHNFYGEDAAYGQLLIESGKKIYFSDEILVRHHHRHSLVSAMKHSFFVSEGMIRLFAHHQGWKKNKQNRGSFGSAPKSLLVSLLFPAAIVINFILAVFINLESMQLIALFFFLWLLVNLRFFTFCSKNETNVRFLALLVPMTFLEQLVRLCGLVAGGGSILAKRVLS